MVSVSGGQNSLGLVHMLKQGIEADHKKLLFNPVLLWVDEGAVFDYNNDRRRENAEEMFSVLSEFGFPVNIVLLEDCNSDQVTVFTDPALIRYTDHTTLTTTFQRLKDKSSREELLIQVNTHFLLAEATQY